jgi:hypothetical protein
MITSRARIILLLAAVTLPVISAVWAADSGPVTYYVQLIRGTRDSRPPASDAKPVGPKLAKPLRGVFNWTNYWEMSRQEVAVPRGKKTRVTLNKERTVEIDLTQDGHRKVTAFEDGKPVSTITSASGDHMTIIGGDRATNTAWFIVVRHDKPKD